MNITLFERILTGDISKKRNLGGLIFITSSQKLSYSNTYTTNTPIAKSSHNLQEQGIISQAFLVQHVAPALVKEGHTEKKISLPFALLRAFSGRWK